MDQRRSMSKMRGVVFYMVIGMILELMMMVLFISGLVKLINYPKHDHSGAAFLWFLFIVVGAGGGGIVFVTATIVLCCWWRKNKTKQFQSEKLPIIPSNSATV